MPGSFSASAEDIEAALKSGTGFQGGKLRIYRMYQQPLSTKEVIAFLKTEYGPFYGHSITFTDGSRGSASYSGKGLELYAFGKNGKTTVRWTELEKQLRQLIQSDRI